VIQGRPEDQPNAPLGTYPINVGDTILLCASAQLQRARTSSAQAPERYGETWGKCPEKARSRSGHALVAS